MIIATFWVAVFAPDTTLRSQVPARECSVRSGPARLSWQRSGRCVFPELILVERNHAQFPITISIFSLSPRSVASSSERPTFCSPPTACRICTPTLFSWRPGAPCPVFHLSMHPRGQISSGRHVESVCAGYSPLFIIIMAVSLYFISSFLAQLSGSPLTKIYKIIFVVIWVGLARWDRIGERAVARSHVRPSRESWDVLFFLFKSASIYGWILVAMIRLRRDRGFVKEAVAADIRFAACCRRHHFRSFRENSSSGGHSTITSFQPARSSLHPLL